MNRRFEFVVVGSSTCLVALLLFGAVRGRGASTDDPYRHLAVFSEVLSRIKSEYVEEPDIKAVTLGAINGLLESIDPYASYLNADQYKQYMKQKDASKGGVGLVLSKRLGYVGVIATIPGSAAAKANLTTGDVIETINKVATRDMPLAFAELLLKGEPGSSVEVTVLRVRKPEPQKITLLRSVIVYPAVTAKMLPDQIGHIVVPSLLAGRAKDVAAKVEEMQKQGAKRLVLDLRNCATGGPEEGIKLANLFMDKGLITYLTGQKVARQNFDAVASSKISSLPMAVLINRGTAGGSEIAAAALLDSKRAELIGERSYGDAAQRKTLTMDDGSAIILAVAKYYGPNGKSIQDNAVTPPVSVIDTDPVADIDDDAVDQPEPAAPAKGEDVMLKKAIEVLTTNKATAAAKPAPVTPKRASNEIRQAAFSPAA